MVWCRRRENHHSAAPRACRHYRSPAAGEKHNKNKRLFCSSLRAVIGGDGSRRRWTAHLASHYPADKTSFLVNTYKVVCHGGEDKILYIYIYTKWPGYKGLLIIMDTSLSSVSPVSCNLYTYSGVEYMYIIYFCVRLCVCIGRVVKLNGEESAAAARALSLLDRQIYFGPEIVAIKIYELYIIFPTARNSPQRHKGNGGWYFYFLLVPRDSWIFTPFLYQIPPTLSHSSQGFQRY